MTRPNGTRPPTSALVTEQAEREAATRVRVPQVTLPMPEILDGKWMSGAMCLPHRLPPGVDAESFHPLSLTGQNAVTVARTQQVCANCPFNQPCREFRYAIGASGTWAGVNYAAGSTGIRTARQKCALMRCTNPVRQGSGYCSPVCEHKTKVGTVAGFELHFKNPDVLGKACTACREAKVRAVARYHQTRAPRGRTTAA